MTEIHRTRLAESKNVYGFEVIHETQNADQPDKTYWHYDGEAKFKIDEDRYFAEEPMIYLDGTDSGGYDSCWVPVDAKQARAIAELLMKLADDLETGAWKK